MDHTKVTTSQRLHKQDVEIYLKIDETELVFLQDAQNTMATKGKEGVLCEEVNLYLTERRTLARDWFEYDMLSKYQPLR